MNCEQCKDILVRYIEGLLAESEKQTLDSHLNTCPPCRDELAQLKALRSRLTANGKTLARSDLENAVIDQIVREQSLKLKKASQVGNQVQLWRKIMESRITKSVAAVIVVVVMFGVVRTAVFGDEQTSEALTGLSFSLPRRAAEVEIETLQARGKVFVAQLPSEENDYELVLTFDDDKLGAADWYEVVVNVTPIGGWATKTSPIYIKAYIDGISSLTFKDNSVYWQHVKWQPPGRHDGNNYATYINEVEWVPQWPQAQDEEYRGGHTSEVLGDLPFSLPRAPADIQIEAVRARAEVSVTQFPSEENDYELVLAFDDDKAGAADWYEVLVHVSPTGSWKTQKFTIHIKAYIDGVSNLIFKDNTVYWHHLKWAAPGRHEGNNYATYINDIEWIPEWLKVTDPEYRGERKSEVLADLPFSLPKQPVDVHIELDQTRGPVSLAQSPSYENDYELVVTFDDDRVGAAGWYEAVIHVSPTGAWKAEPFSIRVKAYIDGVSNLIFKDNTVYWHHLKWAAPGRHEGNNYATYLNDIEWMPEWPQELSISSIPESSLSSLVQPAPDDAYRGDRESEVLADLPFSVPKQPADIHIEAVQARGPVSVAQSPLQENGYELVVRFDDNNSGAADWYEVVVHLTPAGGETTQPLRIRVKAYIDGVSDLVFKDNTVYWHHLRWAAPGRHEGNNYPTYINDIEWIPQWPQAEPASSALETSSRAE
jgi:hypothetical protein